jgi:hypothetical protein
MQEDRPQETSFLHNLEKGMVNKRTIQAFLQDPGCKKVFLQYLQDSHCTENFNCWYAIQKYKTMEDPEKRRVMALELFAKYVNEDSEQAVTITHSVRQELEVAIKRDSFDSNTFTRLEQAAFCALAHSNFCAFLASDMWKAFKEDTFHTPQANE